MPVNPKQIALYERDQRVNQRPAVYTYRPTAPGIPSKPAKTAKSSAARSP